MRFRVSIAREDDKLDGLEEIADKLKRSLYEIGKSNIEIDLGMENAIDLIWEE